MGQPKKCERHNKRFDTCKDCKDVGGGKNLCKHNRPNWRCKDCGTGYCEHNKRNNDCDICNSSKIKEYKNKTDKKCDHNKRKDRCDICTPCRRCNHGLIKSKCVECKKLKNGTIKKFDKKSLESRSLIELKDFCKEKSISGYSRKTKNELITLIREFKNLN